MGLFRIYQDKSGVYNVLFKIDKEIEFLSLGHKTYTDCLHVLRFIKRFSQTETAYKLEKLSCGSWIFKLLNLRSKKVIGCSSTYRTKDVLNKKREYFKNKAINAKLDPDVYRL